MDVLQVTPWGYPTMSVYWRQPGKSSFEVMPSHFFTKVYSAKASLAERFGVSGTLDIRIADRGEAFVNNRYIQRRVFELVGSKAEGDDWQWSFGDGQTATGRKVTHVFLHDGVYPVMVKKGLNIITQRYGISRDWPMVMRDVTEEPRDYGRAVGGYDFSRSSSVDIMTAVELMKLSGNWDGMMRLCEVLLERPGVTPGEVKGLLETYCDMLTAAGQGQKAAESLEKLATGKKLTDTVVGLYVAAGDIYLYEVGDAAAAARCYRLGRQDDAGSKRMNRSQTIAAGDAYLAEGDYSKANEFYARAGLAGGMVKKNPAAARGDFARQAEDYLRRKEYESQAEVLDRWEDAIPTDRLTGYSAFLRVQMLGEQGRYRPAVNRAMVLVKANPQSQFAPQLLLAAAGYALRESQKPLAGRLAGQLLKDYPESPLCDDAKKLLNEIGNSER